MSRLNTSRSRTGKTRAALPDPSASSVHDQRLVRPLARAARGFAYGRVESLSAPLADPAVVGSEIRYIVRVEHQVGALVKQRRTGLLRRDVDEPLECSTSSTARARPLSAPWPSVAATAPPELGRSPTTVDRRRGRADARHAGRVPMNGSAPRRWRRSSLGAPARAVGSERLPPTALNVSSNLRDSLRLRPFRLGAARPPCQRRDRDPAGRRACARATSDSFSARPCAACAVRQIDVYSPCPTQRLADLARLACRVGLGQVSALYFAVKLRPLRLLDQLGIGRPRRRGTPPAANSASTTPRWSSRPRQQPQPLLQLPSCSSRRLRVLRSRPQGH